MCTMCVPIGGVLGSCKVPLESKALPTILKLGKNIALGEGKCLGNADTCSVVDSISSVNRRHETWDKQHVFSSPQKSAEDLKDVAS